jgi:hypothetical protein
MIIMQMHMHTHMCTGAYVCSQKERESWSFDQNKKTFAVDTDAEIHDSKSSNPLAPQTTWNSCIHI